ncbi:MAG: hypothetical protein E7350_04820 [Clostridiales bacterium]|nr:hypothetical protein [Clostridiales bacterium]
MKISRVTKDRLIAAASVVLIVAFFFGLFGIAKSCEQKEYTVSFYDGKTLIGTVTVEEGTTVPRFTPDEDVAKGRTFDCWVTESGDEYDFSLPVQSDLSLYARWNNE